MNAFEKMSIEELVGEAYNIGHAHGMNPFRMLEGRQPQRVDDGWWPIAEEVERRVKLERVAGLRHAAEIVKNNQILDTRYVPDHSDDIEAEARKIEGSDDG